MTACLPEAPSTGRPGSGSPTPRRADGSVPEMGARPARVTAPRAFTACYHSTLVTAFAGTLARIASDGATARRRCRAAVAATPEKARAPRDRDRRTPRVAARRRRPGSGLARRPPRPLPADPRGPRHRERGDRTAQADRGVGAQYACAVPGGRGRLPAGTPAPDSCWTSPGASCWTAATCWRPSSTRAVLARAVGGLRAPSTSWATATPAWRRRWRSRRRTTTWSALEMAPNRRLGVLNAERKLGLTPSSDFGRGRGAHLARPDARALDGPAAHRLRRDAHRLPPHQLGRGAGPHPAGHRLLSRAVPARLDGGLGGPRTLGPAGRTPRRRRLPAPAHARRGPVGAVRGRAAPVRGDAHSPEMPEGDAAEVFDLVHHPTLVAAFASAMATSRALSAVR